MKLDHGRENAGHVADGLEDQGGWRKLSRALVAVVEKELWHSTEIQQRDRDGLKNRYK